MTSHSKHIGIKYHWLRSKIIPTDSHKIVVLRIDTEERRVELFINGLTKLNFEQKRK